MSDIEIPDLKKYTNLEKFPLKKDKYILDEDKNIIRANLMEWSLFMENKKNETIVKQEIVNGKFISTVFIGLDCSMFDDKTYIFETMVFDNSESIYCVRSSTWKEAEDLHEIAVEWVNDRCKDKE